MSDRRAPFVAVRTDVRKDERVSVIADVGGYNRYEALGRLVDLWCWCADRKLEDAPEDCEGYAVPEAVTRRFLGSRGVEAILGDGCDELALGERRPDGLIYLRGTSETVRGLRRYAQTTVAGGHARASGAERDNGRFVSEHTIDQRHAGVHASIEPASSQHPTSEPPAQTSVDPRSKILDPESGDPPLSPLGGPIDSPRKAALKATPTTELPPGWQPRPEERTKARELGVDLAHEVEQFRDSHTAKGNVFADWDAAFRNWLRNAQRFARRTPTTQQPTPLQLQLERVRMLEAREAEEQARQQKGSQP
jgi:hypothetical protein